MSQRAEEDDDVKILASESQDVFHVLQKTQKMSFYVRIFFGIIKVFIYLIVAKVLT